MLCCYYAEFDNRVGPKILYQTPSGTISPGLFDQISDYSIAPPALCKKLITLGIDNKIFMAYPVSLSNRKYDRHALFFSVGFVFEQRCDTQPYRPLLCKLGSIIECLELESEFLFRPETKSTMEHIVANVYHQLKRHGTCLVPVNESNTIRLKLLPKLNAIPNVYGHDVPVPLLDLAGALNESWDVTFKEIIPYINGVNSLKRISGLAGVHMELVLKCARQLLFFQCVHMVDIFQFSNEYVVTDNIHAFAKNQDAQESCLEYVLDKRSQFKQVTFDSVLRLYLLCQRGCTVMDLYIRHNMRTMPIDPRKFVTYGIINKLLVRVHKYPVLLQKLAISKMKKNAQQKKIRENSVSAQASTRPMVSASMRNYAEEEALLHSLAPLLDGTHHYDELCSRLSMSAKALGTLLSAHGSLVTIIAR